MTDLTPREIVSELDKFIIGQNSAKKAVAIALRSRWRRKKVNSPLREEIFPKNILMICLLYTSPSPRDVEESRMPSSA